MSNSRYPEEFKIEAVKQMTDQGLSIAEVAARLAIDTLLMTVSRRKQKQEMMIQVD